MRHLALALTLCFCAPIAASHAQILGQVRLEVDNLSGNPISSIGQGGDFLLKGFVRDVEPPHPPFGGVFGATFDVPFSANLVTPTGPIAFGSFFALSRTGSFLPGEIHDVGGYSSSLSPPGQSEQFLFSIPFHAGGVGTSTFASMLSLTPGLDFLIYGYNTAIPATQINFIPANLTIVPEPSSFVIAAIAVSAFGFLGFRRRRRPQRAWK